MNIECSFNRQPTLDNLQKFVERLRIDYSNFDRCVEQQLKISIIIPSYNQIKFIEKRILSVLNQNYPNLELIIIDGGSTDGTLDIIKKYEKYLSYWTSEPDEGQSDALNKGFSRATGDIFGWLNSDDLYMPDVFSRVVETFDIYSEKKIIFGDYLTIDSEENLIDYNFAFDFNLNHFKYEGFHLNSQAMFWRRCVHQKFGNFDKSLHRTMDYQMILSFGINEGEDSFFRLPYVLGCFRRHEEQKTKGMDDYVICEHMAMAAKYNYTDKYLSIGKYKRLIFRFRRAFWYFKRGGVVYLVRQIIK